MDFRILEFKKKYFKYFQKTYAYYCAEIYLIQHLMLILMQKSVFNFV